VDAERERLIDTLLREVLGGNAPPDLTDAVLRRAFPSRRRWLFLAAGIAAAASLLLTIVGYFFLRTRGYPEPSASGAYEIVGGGPLQRGAVVRTEVEHAQLHLGGFIQVDVKSATLLRISGTRAAEALDLDVGEIECSVTPGVGSFSVQTALGVVSVKGTRFAVQVLHEKVKEVLEKRMIVRVLTGAVFVAGVWGMVELNEGQQRTFAVEKKTEPPQGKSGVVVGLVINKKDRGWLEVKADGEENARRYYRYGNRPALNKQIDAVAIGDRVRLEWEAKSEGPHIAKIEILKTPEKAKPQEQGKLSDAEFEQLHRELQMPKTGLWAIPWKISIQQARELSVKTGKPIHLWAQDGHPLGVC
jgi:hypothetical protein